MYSFICFLMQNTIKISIVFKNINYAKASVYKKDLRLDFPHGPSNVLAIVVAQN